MAGSNCGYRVCTRSSSASAGVRIAHSTGCSAMAARWDAPTPPNAWSAEGTSVGIGMYSMLF